jgi:predicted acylesterase/phospholipase RssA
MLLSEIYQGGVYEALHEAGIEPDWVVGTSIDPINAAIIYGEEPVEAHSAPPAQM